MADLAYEFDMDIVELKGQTASRRASSLSKDRADYKKRTSSSSRNGRKVTATPVGSDSVTPHRAARAATRTCLAKDGIDASSDMPQISMGQAGAWKRWMRKPSVSKSLDFPDSAQQVATGETSHRFLPAEGTDEEVLKLQMKVEEEGRVMLENIRMRAMEKAEEMKHVAEGAVALSECSVGAVAKEVQCENRIGFDDGVADAAEVASLPESVNDAGAFDVNLGDMDAFPALGPMQTKTAPLPPRAEEAEAESETCHDELLADFTPEKLSQPIGKESPKVACSELKEDWVIVSFDAQHPRNVFAKKTASQSTKSKGGSQEAACSIDWSQSGIPTEVKKQLIHASANPAHQGLHAKSQSTPIPFDIMRTQNIGSSRRQKSVPKSPRSHSKPRGMRQAACRR